MRSPEVPKKKNWYAVSKGIKIWTVLTLLIGAVDLALAFGGQIQAAVILCYLEAVCVTVLVVMMMRAYRTRPTAVSKSSIITARMFASLNRPENLLYVPTPRYFIPASVWVAVALAFGVKFIVSLGAGALIPRCALLVVMAALVVGWVQAWLTYRSIRTVESGGAAEASLLQRYKIQLRRVILTALVLTLLFCVFILLRM
jgi:hypothetical protein